MLTINLCLYSDIEASFFKKNISINSKNNEKLRPVLPLTENLN